MSLTVDDLRGRLIDCDSHENLPVPLWSDAFGDAAGLLGQQYTAMLSNPDSHLNDFCRENVVDEMDVTTQTVWGAKGCTAPGAIDITRRSQVLDAMGVDRQLVFPTMGLMAAQVYIGRALMSSKGHGGRVSEERKKVGAAALQGYNDWVIGTTKEVNSDRIRILPFLLLDSLEQMMADTETLLSAGARGVVVAASLPPAGTSPANPVLDPFWSLLEEANAPFVIHGGPDLYALGAAFSDSPTLRTDSPFSSPELPEIGPYAQSFLEIAPAHFLGTMLLGGVFERHPRLRCGVIECKALWLPLLAQQLELHNKVFTKKEQGSLPLRPSEYLARNVRVTPFVYEPIDRIIQQAPELVDCYVFSSDYPHFEGGKAADRRFSDMIAPLGDDVAEKFFVTNGELLLPA